MSDLFWITITCIKGLGNKRIMELYKQHPSLNFHNVAETMKTYKKTGVVNLLTKEKIEKARIDAQQLIKEHEENKIKLIPISSASYPPYLRLIDDPPKILYAKGNITLLKEEDTLAIIGTRKPTRIGLKAAEKIAKTFAQAGYTIVSGLALGIDTAGHMGALKTENGKTIAVLAGNVRDIYPAKNKGLADKILAHDGLLISETPLGQASIAGRFVQRNRIQSGLSLAVCPVQTPMKSGSQHTVKFAKEQGRFLFTPIPLQEDLQENAVEGNLAMIREGITVLENKDSYKMIAQTLKEYKVKLKKQISNNIPHQPVK